MYKFAPASPDESTVFGAARPGYANQEVQAWIEFMQSQNIQRVCCLLSKDQLARYNDLLNCYRQAFGLDQVGWAGIADFQICDRTLLQNTILPFLAESNQHQQKTVVHCSGGIGRTGQVLAAWLIAGRGLSRQTAIRAVRRSGRNPYEAVIAAPLQGKNPLQVLAELNDLLDSGPSLNILAEFEMRQSPDRSAGQW